MRLFIVLSIVLGMQGFSRAEKAQLLGELSVGYLLASGELGSSDLPFHTEIGGGFRVGRISWELFGDMKSYAPTRSDLHSESVVDWSLGTQIRWFVSEWAYVRLGGSHSWIHGTKQVQRTCTLTGACDGGFYNESPDYSGVASRAGVGIYTSGSPSRRTTMAIAADLGVERMSFPLFRQQKSQYSLMLSLGVFLTGGNDLQGKE